jgi:O-antigen biosynthesis protein
VLDNGSRRSVSAHLVRAFADQPRVRVERVPRNLNFALGSNVGSARSTGGTVVFLNNDTEPQAGWLEPLLAPLADPAVLGVQPLLLYPDGTIQTAGTVFPPGAEFPVHTLVGEAPAAAEAHRSRKFGVVTAAALAMRAEDVVALRGFDPEFVNGLEDVDLCLRALQLRPGHFRVATDSVVLHHESKTEGRMLHAAANKDVFRRRWAGRYPEPR